MPKLKQFLTESEITDDIKGAYTKKGDRYELNELSDDHSLVVAQREVNEKYEARQTQLNDLTTKLTNAERERDEAKQKAVPHGYRAVKADVAELGEAVKQSGLSKDELASLKTENDAFKAEKQESEMFSLRKEAGAFLGYPNTEAFAKLASKLALEKDDSGKFNYRDGETLKPLTKEFVEAHADFTPFLSSLTEKPRIAPFPESENHNSLNEYDAIRQEVKAEKGEAVLDASKLFTPLGGTK